MPFNKRDQMILDQIQKKAPARFLQVKEHFERPEDAPIGYCTLLRQAFEAGRKFQQEYPGLEPGDTDFY